MATVHYRNARILVGGYDLTASFTELSVDYACETLDETTFGDTTRINKGGLFTATINGKGYLEMGAGAVESVLFSIVGVDDTPIVLFADGITEGTTTDKGFAMLGCLSVFNIGGTVGAMLPFDFTAVGHGVTP